MQGSPRQLFWGLMFLGDQKQVHVGLYIDIRDSVSL